MTYPHRHKTAIILDKSSQFLESSKHAVEFDVFTKSRGTGIIPLAPIFKSLWTCNVEAAVEYCRVVYDVYPTTSVIQMITSDREAKTVSSWDRQQQNLAHVMTSLAQHDGPKPKEGRSDDSNIIHGLNAAVEAMCEATPAQDEYVAKGDSELINNGRIICLTSIKSESHLQMLEECVQDAISQHSKLAAVADNLLPINHIDMVFLHTVPCGAKSTVTHKLKRDISSALASEVHVTQSGTFVSNKTVELCAQHYNLASTTVTGIPMKEELNASSSANYDVELLHPAEGHIELFKTGNAEGLTIPSKEGLYLDTVTLKWCTPKSSSVELHQTTGAYRVTPVDVNSRPSSCLTNFLLNGKTVTLTWFKKPPPSRSVMLEQPRKTGTKVISHMLTSHGGELYIHVLATQRSCLEDPPSISEGCGGRVTDYRISDFGELMKDTRLAPLPTASSSGPQPIDKAKKQMERMTRYWPLVIGDTLIFNMLSHLDPLHTLVVKESLDDDELLDCRKAIFHLVGMESRNDPLPVPAAGTRGKGPKREEQYRQMWSELERFIRAHAENSPEHQKVLECLLECKRPSDLDKEKKVKEEKQDTSDKAWHDKFKDKADSKDIKRETSDSPPPPIKKAKTGIDFHIPKSGAPQSLLSLWTSRVDALNSIRCPEFAGRLDHGNKAPLYEHMNDDSANQDTEEKPNTQKNTASGNKPLSLLKSKTR